MRMIEEELFEKCELISKELREVLLKHYNGLDPEDKLEIIFRLQEQFRFWT